MNIEAIVWVPSTVNAQGDVSNDKPTSEMFLGKPFLKNGKKIGEILNAVYDETEKHMKVTVKVDEENKEMVREAIEKNKIHGVRISTNEPRQLWERPDGTSTTENLG